MLLKNDKRIYENLNVPASERVKRLPKYLNRLWLSRRDNQHH